MASVVIYASRTHSQLGQVRALAAAARFCCSRFFVGFVLHGFMCMPVEGLGWGWPWGRGMDVGRVSGEGGGVWCGGGRGGGGGGGVDVGEGVVVVGDGDGGVAGVMGVVVEWGYCGGRGGW